MVNAQMAPNAAQVHPIHVHLDRFPAHFFRVSPGFGMWGVLDLAEHAAIALASAACFPGSILAFRAVTVWTFNHSLILAHFLATPGHFPAKLLC